MHFSEFVSHLKFAIKVIYEPKIGVRYSNRHISTFHNLLKKNSVDLIGTFQNINGASSNLMPIVSVKFVIEGSIVSSVFLSIDTA